MKVIKEGTAHLTDITCDRCRSELQYESADIKHINNGKEITTYIWCPVCHHKIIIDKQPIEYQEPKKQKWWQWFIEDSDWPPM